MDYMEKALEKCRLLKNCGLYNTLLVIEVE